MEKKQFENAYIEIIETKNEDIITTSVFGRLPQDYDRDIDLFGLLR